MIAEGKSGSGSHVEGHVIKVKGHVVYFETSHQTAAMCMDLITIRRMAAFYHNMIQKHAKIRCGYLLVVTGGV